MCPHEPGDSRPARKRPSIDVPPSVLSILSDRIGEAPRVSLHEEASDAGGAPLIDPASDERAAVPEGRANYQVLGEIARGGMGVVLRGHDTDLGRDVAMKVLAKELAHRPEVVQRFVEEAQIGGQLQHPGIVPVYELGLMADERPYFTMKLVKGRTLATLLADREEVGANRRRLIDVFEATCQTVAYAHSRGVIHRDLKPANIMVGAFGEVQVVDWGLAKVLNRGGMADEKRAREARSHLTVLETVRSDGSSTGSESQVGSVLGTPAYMPPEQARGQVDKLDERADVFSLGAILCEILTGAPPYTGPKDQIIGQAAQAELEDAYARLEACGADAGLVKLATRCLVAAPAARPRNAGVLAEAVQAHLEGQEQRSREAQIEAAEARVRATQERKARKLTLLLATSVLLLVGVGGGGWAWVRSEEVQREATAARLETERVQRERELERDVEEALTEARLLAERKDWPAATALLERAQALAAAGGGGIELTFAVAAAASEIEGAADAARAARELELDTARLLAELDEARNPLGTDITLSQVERDRAAFERFPEIFAAHGIDVVATDSAALGRALRERGLGADLAMTLDAWAASRRGAGDEATALHLLELAHEVDPDPVRADLREALANGDVEMLTTLAGEDLGDQPAATLELLATSLERLGERDAAFEVLEYAAAVHPDAARVHRLLALALAGGPRFLLDPKSRLLGRRALIHAWAAVALEPENALFRVDLGMLHLRMNEVQAARRVLEQAVALSEDSAWARMGLAGMLAYSDPADPGGLENARQAAANADSRMLKFWSQYMVAQSHRGQGDRDAAIEAALEAAQHLDNIPDEHSSLVALFVQLGEIDRPRSTIEEMAASYSLGENNVAWALATEDLSEVEDLDVRRHIAAEAVRWAELSLERNPEFRRVWNTLGAARLRAEDYAGALEAFERSMEHQGGPGAPEDWFGLSICHAELGAPELARAWFERGRIHVDGTIDQVPSSGLTMLVNEAARRLGIPSPIPVE